MTTKNKLKKIRDVWEEISKEPEKKVSKDVKKSIDVTTIFAGNSTGKTRLSKHIWDAHREDVLIYYNAYTEDLFSWNNDEIVLKFDHENKFLKTIKDKRIDTNKINENFNEFTGLSISIDMDFDEGRITFSKNSASNGDDGRNKFEPNNQIKLESKNIGSSEVIVNISNSSDDIARSIEESKNADIEVVNTENLESKNIGSGEVIVNISNSGDDIARSIGESKNADIEVVNTESLESKNIGSGEVIVNISNSSDDIARSIEESKNTDIEVVNTESSENENIDNRDKERIKISKGEESIFIWSIFYTILVKLIEDLHKEQANPKNSVLPKYVIIDDPVSSMDDKRIITIALELRELISKSKNKVKFLVTTHHALFYNVLLNFRGGWKQKNYVLTKSNDEFFLKNQGDKDPFAYHHYIIEEIKNTKPKMIEKYHFNLFRTILEKTANFLRCDSWSKLLPESEGKQEIVKLLNQFSHDRFSELGPKFLSLEEKKKFKQVFESFIEKFEWFKHDSR